DSSQLEVLTKKPITAQAEEQAQNSRSRSAKLRFAQKPIVNSH
ncbi:MAG: 16S rRNA (cytosine(1402)-N(4))-methyltransferase, partial [Cyanobacteria bacterium QH_8_48_120]